MPGFGRLTGSRNAKTNLLSRAMLAESVLELLYKFFKFIGFCGVGILFACDGGAAELVY